MNTKEQIERLYDRYGMKPDWSQCLHVMIDRLDQRAALFTGGGPPRRLRGGMAGVITYPRQVGARLRMHEERFDWADTRRKKAEKPTSKKRKEELPYTFWLGNQWEQK